MRSRYDAVLIGAGLSGLSLACHLVTQQTEMRRIAVVDPTPLAGPDRGWAYWSRASDLVSSVACREWERVRVSAAGSDEVVPLTPYRYRRLQAAQLEDLARRLLEHNADVDVVAGRAHQVCEADDGAVVETDTRPLAARWVFDSRPRAAPVRAHLVVSGWHVQVDAPLLDPEVPTLVDFRTSQEGVPQFLHVLPLDERHAVVEDTAFTVSGAHRRPRGAGPVLDYLRHVLGAQAPTVTAAGHAEIPLVPPPPRVLGRHHLAIGAAAGLVKASTGYGCDRIQRDSASIARSLQRHGHPFAVPGRSRRHAYLDDVLLRVLRVEPAQLERVFAAMFAATRMARSLRFLDEDTRWYDEARLVAVLPRAPFLRAALSPSRAVPLSS